MNTRPTIAHWLRANFFRSLFDGLLTILVSLAVAAGVASIARWAVMEADWSVVVDNLRFLAVGTLPLQDGWRAEVAGSLVILLAAQTVVGGVRLTRRVSAMLIVGALLAIAGTLAGIRFVTWSGIGVLSLALLAPWMRRFPGAISFPGLLWAAGAVAIASVLAPTNPDRIGGFLLTLMLTATTAVISLPLGILLALGRRSQYLPLRMLCTAYIELVRSLPLLLVVYWIWLMLPLLLPGWHSSDIVRAGGAFALFVSAYVAEYVRTGLQAVHAGQIEAAKSLGLKPSDVNRFIVIPQALRTVFPALVGNVLEIFNAVPLLFIIGSVDLLRAGQIILSNPAYGANTMEMYIFIFVVYFAVGSVLTLASRRLERRANAAR